MKKRYVLDTNILIQSPESIFGFEDNDVIITGTTLQELDGLKDAGGDTGHAAVKVNHLIEKLYQTAAAENPDCSYIKGIPLSNGGTFYVEPNNVTNNNLPPGYKIDKPDNRILSACVGLKNAESRSAKLPIILVTNDVSMRTNASICGIRAQGYRNEQAGYENVYLGKTELMLNSAQIDRLYADRKIQPDEELKLAENEYLVIKSVDDSSKSALGQFSKGEIHLVSGKKESFGVKPKNTAQKFAIDALLNPDFDIVILQGPAGCAKTFLSLACGLEQTALCGYRDEHTLYDEIMITRANVLSDADMGFLPGTLDEKMAPLIAPFRDNLNTLFRLKGDENDVIQMKIEEMFYTRTIDVQAVAYMRGRSITNTYIIVDEAQNTTPGQIKEIITRAGDGTKIVICGDPEQIDSPKLDRYNNGLVYAAEKMKGYEGCAQLVFNGEKDSVRSRLAREAAKRL